MTFGHPASSQQNRLVMLVQSPAPHALHGVDGPTPESPAIPTLNYDPQKNPCLAKESPKPHHQVWATVDVAGRAWPDGVFRHCPINQLIESCAGTMAREADHFSSCIPRRQVGRH